MPLCRCRYLVRGLRREYPRSSAFPVLPRGVSRHPSGLRRSCRVGLYHLLFRPYSDVRKRYLSDQTVEKISPSKPRRQRHREKPEEPRNAGTGSCDGVVGAVRLLPPFRGCPRLDPCGHGLALPQAPNGWANAVVPAAVWGGAQVGWVAAGIARVGNSGPDDQAGNIREVAARHWQLRAKQDLYLPGWPVQEEPDREPGWSPGNKDRGR